MYFSLLLDDNATSTLPTLSKAEKGITQSTSENENIKLTGRVRKSSSQIAQVRNVEEHIDRNVYMYI